MWKKNSVEFQLNRLTGIWILCWIGYLWVFLGKVETLRLEVWNCTSLGMLFGEILASPDFHWQYTSILFISFVVLFVHMYQGILNIFHDYIHDEKSKYLSQIILVVMEIQVLKYLYIFFFF